MLFVKKTALIFCFSKENSTFAPKFLYVKQNYTIMTREEIGANAGAVWNALNGNGTLSVKNLKKVTKLKDKQIFAALGWLAREGKVSMNETETDVEVTLVG